MVMPEKLFQEKFNAPNLGWEFGAYESNENRLLHDHFSSQHN